MFKLPEIIRRPPEAITRVTSYAYDTLGGYLTGRLWAMHIMDKVSSDLIPARPEIPGKYFSYALIAIYGLAEAKRFSPNSLTTEDIDLANIDIATPIE